MAKLTRATERAKRALQPLAERRADRAYARTQPEGLEAWHERGRAFADSWGGAGGGAGCARARGGGGGGSPATGRESAARVLRGPNRGPRDLEVGSLLRP